MQSLNLSSYVSESLLVAARESFGWSRTTLVARRVKLISSSLVYFCSIGSFPGKSELMFGTVTIQLLCCDVFVGLIGLTNFCPIIPIGSLNQF